MDKESKTVIRKLQAQVGNLEVQNSDYQQIVNELTKKLEQYEDIHGTVFKPARNSQEKK